MEKGPHGARKQGETLVKGNPRTVGKKGLAQAEHSERGVNLGSPTRVQFNLGEGLLLNTKGSGKRAQTKKQ